MKTRKTASTSIERYLSLYNTDQDNTLTNEVLNKVNPVFQPTMFTKHHAAAIDIIDVIGLDSWNNYTKITSIRNPYESVISSFFFLYEFFKTPIDNEEATINQFRNFVREHSSDHYLTQLINDRITYSLDNKICADYIIKVESLQEDLELVCRKLNLPFYPEKIEKLNSSARPKWATCNVMYNNETKSIIESLFEFELSYFNYNFPNLNKSQ